ncbi:hydroxyacylglutathione hydrolase [Candidatus Kinetoplastidibacterium desouzai]|uniref:hydroxyacylglutathione hydrolase n=1 Tax=Candidatus Kinetoplastidibacterium desouzai TaxID=994692 RepID=UPI00059E6C6E|nr:hydroxyacylglutathione hydrolase [Candidatus Kinetoplastibacterium desouzaii]
MNTYFQQNGILPIKSFNDNYIWTIIKNDKIVVVDPGDHKPILNFINKHSLTLLAILVTHHHNDHVNGIEKLCELNNIPVYASNKTPLSLCNTYLKEDDVILIPELDINLKVINTPGHTNDHISFYGQTVNSNRVLFCGDTLFSGGCGRIFEGTYKQMFQSLKKLSNLPLNTLVFSSHEYTINNLVWAMTVDNNNINIKQYYKHAKLLRKYEYPTLPSSINKELSINPFLRTNCMEIINSTSAHAKVRLKSELDVFIELRKWKNAH